MPHQHDTSAPHGEPTTAIDPVCGMTVSTTTPIRAQRDGNTFYFCCEHCRQKFLGQVATPRLVTLDLAPTDDAACCHAPTAAAKAASAAAKYYCPMCPGVASDAPGDCPQCGMALERNPAWKLPAGKTRFRAEESSAK